MSARPINLFKISEQLTLIITFMDPLGRRFLTWCLWTPWRFIECVSGHL